MQLLLEQIREPFEWEELLELDAAALASEELAELGPVSVRGRLEPVHPGYHLRLRLEWKQVLSCTRCLEPIAGEGRAESHLLVLTGEDEGEGGEVELEAEDLGVLVAEEGQLETDPIVEEQIRLELPMKVLCREDCAGLCSQCGANLNEGACDCRPVRDPRWDALTELSTS